MLHIAQDQGFNQIENLSLSMSVHKFWVKSESNIWGIKSKLNSSCIYIFEIPAHAHSNVEAKAIPAGWFH